LIDESYNAARRRCGAAIAVLDSAAVAPGGRRIAVLGDMLELGAHPPPHAELERALAAADIASATRSATTWRGCNPPSPSGCAVPIAPAPSRWRRSSPRRAAGRVVTVKGFRSAPQAVIVKHLLPASRRR